MQKLDNRKGLSTVITTLIILVVAVLLAGVVTYYATNVVMTRTTQEEVRIRKPHIWVKEGDDAYAALMVQNLGGRDVLIDKIAIRGVDTPWGSVAVPIIDEDLGTLVTDWSSFAGSLQTPVVPGSVTITVGAVIFTETDPIAQPGVLNAGVLGSGTIVYDTGVLNLAFTPALIADTDVTATYYPISRISLSPLGF